MALPGNIADREHKKFVQDAEGNVGIRLGPDAIQDSAGNKLGLNQYGMAQVFDRQLLGELKDIGDTLKDIRFQLQLITGADVHE